MSRAAKSPFICWNGPRQRKRNTNKKAAAVRQHRDGQRPERTNPMRDTKNRAVGHRKAPAVKNQRQNQGANPPQSRSFSEAAAAAPAADPVASIATDPEQRCFSAALAVLRGSLITAQEHVDRLARMTAIAPAAPISPPSDADEPLDYSKAGQRYLLASLVHSWKKMPTLDSVCQAVTFADSVGGNAIFSRERAAIYALNEGHNEITELQSLRHCIDARKIEFGERTREQYWLGGFFDRLIDAGTSSAPLGQVMEGLRGLPWALRRVPSLAPMAATLAKMIEAWDVLLAVTFEGEFQGA